MQLQVISVYTNGSRVGHDITGPLESAQDEHTIVRLIHFIVVEENCHGGVGRHGSGCIVVEIVVLEGFFYILLLLESQ